jgi:hypothetical protein
LITSSIATALAEDGRWSTYAEALAVHIQVNPDGLGSVCVCPHCDCYHVTQRFPQDKRRGRTKRKRGIVAGWSA